MSLTTEQRAVIQHPSGHAKVMAVAGAGKTTTLVYFVRQCLAKGLSPRRILILMYNKSAQVDFQRKLNQLLDKTADRHASVSPEVRTFHSLGLRIYKQLIRDGYLPSFNDALLTDGEIESVVWKLLQQCADEETAKDILDQKSKWVEPATSFIDLAKSCLRTPEEVFEQSGLPDQCRFFSEVFRKFEIWRKAQGKISFSDMLYDPCSYLKENPEVAIQFSGHMQQILVDEYQDINEIQQFLLTTIRGDAGDLMVVGDPDQTIYEFRGSRPEFMTTEFDHCFEGVTLYNLSHTFRYGHRLSLLCNYLIAHNPDRKGVLCLSDPVTPNTRVYQQECEHSSRAVLNIIAERKQDTPLEQIVVLNRIWAISAPIELALLEQGIHYQLDHPVSVLDRKELAPFEALLLIAAGKYPALSQKERIELLLTLLTQPFPKIRRKQLQQMATMASQFGDQPGKAIRDALPDTLSNRQSDQILSRTRLMDHALTGRFTSDELLQKYFTATDMEEGIRDSAFSTQQVDDRLETVRAFLRYYRSLKLPSAEGWDYWQQLRAKRDGRQKGGVRLTSMHRAKGLEWSCVIVPALSERFMPYQPEGELTVPSSEESERRLLYVAMTRAINHLYLLTPKTSDQSRSGHQSKSLVVSPFMAEMSFSVSDLVGAAIEKFASDNGDASQPALAVPVNRLEIASNYIEQVDSSIELKPAPEEPLFQQGLRENKSGYVDKEPVELSYVRHQVYGRGKIIADERRHWVIRFDQGIEKQFDKRVAAQYIEFL